MAATAQYELNNPPKDGISKVRFANTSNFLAVSSWDKTVRYYDPVANELKTTWDCGAPVLDVCHSQNDTVLGSGGLARTLIIHDVETGNQNSIGNHDNAISCVEYAKDNQSFITGSWDCSVAMWDRRSQDPKVGFANTGKKVFAMSTSNNYLVVGTSDRKVFIYDIRNLSTLVQDRESSLKHQTRDIQVNIEETGFLLTSVEGRVAVEYFDPSETWQQRKFAFKCHRYLDKETQCQTVFPVNCAAFHPHFGTFVTGGCDGLVNVWDGDNKKRICQFPQFNTAISALDFNLDGRYLAIGVSYTWEQGEKTEIPEDSICIRNVKEFEVQPKKKRNIEKAFN